MALINVERDVFGLSRPATTLLKGLGHGIGALSSFATANWRHGQRIGHMRDYHTALQEMGLDIESANLTLGERAEIQLQSSKLKQQINIESIGVAAVEHYKNEQSIEGEASSSPIEAEWLDRYWQYASQIGEEERQLLWGRILSRKASGHSSISVRTLHFLFQISVEEAQMISEIAACAYRVINGGGMREGGLLESVYRMPFKPYPEGRPGEEGKIDLWPLPSLEENILGPAGFWVQRGWGHTVTVHRADRIVIEIGADAFEIRPSEPLRASAGGDFVTLGGGTELSSMGVEVVDLVAAKPPLSYVELLQETFQDYGAELIKL